MDRSRSRFFVVAFVALLASGCTYIERASVDTGGDDPDGVSGNASLSADGRYVVFDSFASDLVPNDTNAAFDVFLRDLRTDTTTRVSVDATGGDPNASSGDPSISADGRFVAFHSFASDLGFVDNNNVSDVFVRDLQTSTTTRVSVDIGGGNPNGTSNEQAISPDGRYVAFASEATDLVAGDGTGGFQIADVFVRDLQAGTTERVSVDTGGGDPDGASNHPSISDNGRYVAFESFAPDLVAADGTPIGDAFVRDRQTGTTTRVSVDAGGGDPNARSLVPSITPDGRFVAFVSEATDLVPNDGSSGTSGRDAFVHDRQNGETTRVSIDTSGGDPNSLTIDVSISADGRFVAFSSLATDLVPDDTNGNFDVFVHDRETTTTTRVSVDALGQQPAGAETSAGASISGDGRYVAFASPLDGLVPGGQDGIADVFVRVNPTTTLTSIEGPALEPGTVNGVFTGLGTGFLPGARAFISGPAGVTVSSVTVLSSTEVEIVLSADPSAPPGARGVTVWNPGTGPGAIATSFGACGACITVT